MRICLGELRISKGNVRISLGDVTISLREVRIYLGEMLDEIGQVKDILLKLNLSLNKMFSSVPGVHGTFEILFSQGCGHKFCKTCWQMHFEIQINQVNISFSNIIRVNTHSTGPVPTDLQNLVWCTQKKHLIRHLLT